MKLKPRWGWLLFSVPLVLVLLSYCMVSSAPKILVYEGKSFYQWATELQTAQANYGDPNRWKTIEPITVAIRAMGTNALPYVMADLRAQPTLKDRVLAWLAPRAKFLKLKPENVSDRWVRGSAGAFR